MPTDALWTLPKSLHQVRGFMKIHNRCMFHQFSISIWLPSYKFSKFWILNQQLLGVQFCAFCHPNMVWSCWKFHQRQYFIREKKYEKLQFLLKRDELNVYTFWSFLWSPYSQKAKHIAKIKNFYKIYSLRTDKKNQPGAPENLKNPGKIGKKNHILDSKWA